MSDAAARPDDPPSRPSRQELVVPPRQSTWPIAVGAVASAAAGFGLVLFMGIGRSRPTSEPPAAAAVTNAPPDEAAADADAGDTDAGSLARDAIPTAPGLLPPPEDLVPATSDRWSPRRGSDPPPATQPPADRYAARYPASPASHDEPPTDDPPPGRPMSRFSSPDVLPATAEAIEAGADDQPEPVDQSEPATQPVPAPLPDPADEPLADPRAVAPPVSEASANDLPPPAPKAEANDQAAGSDGKPPAAAALPPVAATPPVEAPAPQAVVPAKNDVADRPQLPQPPLASPGAAAPPAELPVKNPPEAVPAVPAVAAFAVPAGLPSPPPPPPTSPFAAAPPLGPATGGSQAEPPPPAEPPARSAPAGIEGQGLPGPVQLEGVQAPQVAVEKRGPREIQVGKPARYEILVRNVGAAVAHQVALRDTVPQGTSLIATTPPASPAGNESQPTGELVWMLGDLQPGGEVRVLVELMPETEGEVGSVASVSFRADATLRSRATKPELTLDCPAAEPVRIGGDMDVSLTVTNSGSGAATGVVVEAFLPETVSHRAGPELEFDVGQLRPGESKTIDLVLGTRSPGSQPARFVARADGGIEVDRPIPIQVTAPTLELAIDMPSRRFLQRPATCSIAMVNTGTASARSVELAAQLPPGMKFVRANNAGWHDERSHRVLWNLEELPAGETGTVEVVVMPVQAGEQRITAAARSTDGPSDQAIHACQVEGLAAVAFHVADSEDPIEVNGVTEYVVRVANEGTKAASGVRLAANLLGDLEPVEAEGPGGHRIENLAIEFEPLAKLGPGEEVVYRIRARGRRAGHQRVQVQLTSEDHPAPITKEEVTSVYEDR